MAYQSKDQSKDAFVDSNGENDDTLFPMESDAAFSATPLVANASSGDSNAATSDPTFMQNQISIQRSPSTTISQASALSRKLSTKSNGSPETTQPSITGVLHENEERSGRGRGRGNSNASLIEATEKCNLAKSSSVSTSGSAQSVESASSVKSTRSVRSVHAVGSYPLGSLRVHSPSPTRGGVETRHFLKSGDVFIVRDVPSGSLFGYDTRGLVIKNGDDFQGIKDIPPGAHLFWGGSSTSSLRSGFWIMTTKKASDQVGEIHVKRWDKENEVLDEVSNNLQLSPRPI
jgi:A1 cistron-splicing factor AAR2